jgi:farnesyl-diphosphate farnesyltransferase
MPTSHAALPAAVHDAIARRDARRFCEAILPAVSRTFAIGIRVLPGTLGRAVLTAYLLCRVADTIEDAPGIAPETKGPLFDAFLRCFDDDAAVAPFVAAASGVTGEPPHLALVRQADLVFA